MYINKFFIELSTYHFVKTLQKLPTIHLRVRLTP